MATVHVATVHLMAMIVQNVILVIVQQLRVVIVHLMATVQQLRVVIVHLMVIVLARMMTTVATA